MKKAIVTFIIFLLVIAIGSINIVFGDWGVIDVGPGKGQQYPNSLVFTARRILTIIKTIGIILSLVIIMVIGIKYMLGSTEEKSEYKKSLLPYVIGAGMIFTGTLVPSMIYDFIINLKP